MGLALGPRQDLPLTAGELHGVAPRGALRPAESHGSLAVATGAPDNKGDSATVNPAPPLNPERARREPGRA